MKLQIKFKVVSSDDTTKIVSKTFSNINASASVEELRQFVEAFKILNDGAEYEAYQIKIEEM